MARTWYRIGGPARWYIRPRTIEELQEASRRCVENDIPIYVLGLGAKSAGGRCRASTAPSSDSITSIGAGLSSTRAPSKSGAGVDMQKLLAPHRPTRPGGHRMPGRHSRHGRRRRPHERRREVRRHRRGRHPRARHGRRGTVFERTKDDLVFEYRSTNISARFILGATLELEEDDPRADHEEDQGNLDVQAQQPAAEHQELPAASSRTRAASAPAP